MSDSKYILKEVEEESVSIRQIIAKLRKNGKWIVGLSLLVASIAGVFLLTKKDYYKVSAVASSSLFKPNELKPVLSIVSDGIQNLSSNGLSHMLGISEEVVESIVSVKITDLQSSENLKYIFSIELTTTDTGSIDEIYEGLTAYIHSNSYLESQFKQRETELDTMISKLDEQIADLYEFKNETRNLSSRSEKGIVIYPTAIHTEIIELEERKLMLNEEASRLSILEYIQEPLVPEEPIGPKRLVSILAAFLISAFVGGFFVVASLFF